MISFGGADFSRNGAICGNSHLIKRDWRPRVLFRAIGARTSLFPVTKGVILIPNPGQ